MKKRYLVLSVLGFLAPNIPVIQVSLETGNWLFWLDPAATMHAMFPNAIATAFIIDLLFAVLVFFIWTYHEAKRYQMPNVWVYWLLTMLFGMAGVLPLFLYQREARRLAKA